MAEFACTPGQTVGPFLDLGLPYHGDSNLVEDRHPDAVRLHGTVYDGAGDAVPDALVELWQADAAGRIPRRAGSLRHRDSFTGWGRSATDAAGHYAFTTLEPGSVSAGRPAFFAITLFARGLLDRLFTRAYLPDGELDADPLLASLDAARRSALLCAAENGLASYRFDIHLQGPRETVFLAYRDGQR
jgi:protocatechuate 3,4-dioxygenase, alpha subunit